jgi:Caspase recruitment domain
VWSIVKLPMLTNDDKIGRLLDFLPKTGNRGFETFIKALVETDQSDVALLLDEEYARPLIDAKTSARGTSSFTFICSFYSID